jgi:magnesium-transporting ATPase (P-type)
MSDLTNNRHSVLKHVIRCIVAALLSYAVVSLLMFAWHENSKSANTMQLQKNLEYAMLNLYSFYFLVFLYTQIYLYFLVLQRFVIRLRIGHLLICAIIIGWLASGTAEVLKNMLIYPLNHRYNPISHPDYIVFHSFLFMSVLSGGWLLGILSFVFTVKLCPKNKNHVT